MDTKEAEQQEAVLEKCYWNELISRGATTGRFYISDPKSPWVIVDEMIQRHHSRPLQEGIVKGGTPFNQTSAVRILSVEL